MGYVLEFGEIAHRRVHNYFLFLKPNGHTCNLSPYGKAFVTQQTCTKNSSLQTVEVGLDAIQKKKMTNV